LGAKGTHGSDPNDAAKTLIERGGVRHAIRESFLDPDDVLVVQEVDRSAK